MHSLISRPQSPRKRSHPPKRELTSPPHDNTGNRPSLSSRRKGAVDDSPTSWTLVGTVSSSCLIVFSASDCILDLHKAGGEGLNRIHLFIRICQLKSHSHLPRCRLPYHLLLLEDLLLPQIRLLLGPRLHSTRQSSVNNRKHHRDDLAQHGTPQNPQ
ncbi:hypothetical protein Tco_1029040 [Tanacetum coccineum]|uniref:Uncharacterized protein n=1 Tax=Tanacetum coccineum TaxID=301880 RepID=A0ABQ5G3V9_9ASTR